MAELRKVLNDSAGMNEDQFKEMITQNSLFPDTYNSNILFASDFEDEDEEEEEFEEEDEDLLDEDELVEEEGYEEDFDFDEEEDEEAEDEDVGTYN